MRLAAAGAIAAALAALILSAAPAGAERLIASLSNHRVMVTPNFNGDEIVLFGAIESDTDTQPHRGGYDVVVTVAGPKQNQVTFRKDRILGIWVNYESRVFEDAPAYLAALSNRPFSAITDNETLRKQQIGIENTALLQRASAAISDSSAADPFRVAFVSLKRQQGLYREDVAGVTFLSSTLYRASIPLPAEAPIGTYSIDVKLFADGAMIARTNTALEVYKVGFEQAVTSAAHNHGVLYGLVTTMMALLTGWIASVVFRRD